MQAPNKTIEKAKANGCLDQTNQLLSAAFLLNSEAYRLVDEASELLRKNGMLMGELKQLHGQFTKITDRYFREFSSMMVVKESKMNYLVDLDDFDSVFRKWMKLDHGLTAALPDKN